MKTYLESMHEIVTVNTQFLRTSKGEYLIMANGVILVQKDGDRGYAEDARVWAQSQIVEIERAVAENQAQAQAVALDNVPVLDLDHAKKMKRERMRNRPTWDQEKRWFKESVALKHYLSAVGANHA